MGEVTGIEWTHHTFNPWIGCTRVSPGCDNCYADRGSARLGAQHGLKLWEGDRYFTGAAYWRQPERWQRAALEAGQRRRVFCASFADVFDQLPMPSPYRNRMYAARAELFRTIEGTPGLDWLLLTKRPEVVRAMVPEDWLTRWPANAWMGTTVESQELADKRIPELLNIPAPVRFVSYEPAIEGVDLTRIPTTMAVARDADDVGVVEGATVNALTGDVRSHRGRTQVGPRLHWVIVGGESGPRARPFDLVWARLMREACRDAGVAFFMKQLGSVAVDGAHMRGARKSLLELKHKKGGDPAEWPEALRVREFPKAVFP